jgi:hypothetical protein
LDAGHTRPCATLDPRTRASYADDFSETSRTSLMACATTSNPRAPATFLPRAAVSANPRRPLALPAMNTLFADAAQRGIAAATPRNATVARADAATPRCTAVQVRAAIFYVVRAANATSDDGMSVSGGGDVAENKAKRGHVDFWDVFFGCFLQRVLAFISIF